MADSRFSKDKLDKTVADAQKGRQSREGGYRAKSLKMYPWICGRCMREFDNSNVHELTVHHRNHDHDYNPEDGSNWELLCLYCHDNEHQRYIDESGSGTDEAAGENATQQPFADLKALLAAKK
jgi:hypothetical protein